MKDGRIGYGCPDVISTGREVKIQAAVRALRSIVLLVRENFFEKISRYLKVEKGYVRQRDW